MKDNKITLHNLTGEEQTGVNQDSFSTMDEEIRLLTLNNLLDMKTNSKVNSRINKQQVHALTKLFMFADTFKNNFTRNLAQNILHLQVSIQGLGRRELVQILQTTESYSEEQPSKKNVDIFR